MSIVMLTLRWRRRDISFPMKYACINARNYVIRPAPVNCCNAVHRSLLIYMYKSPASETHFKYVTFGSRHVLPLFRYQLIAQMSGLGVGMRCTSVWSCSNHQRNRGPQHNNTAVVAANQSLLLIDLV